jgi:hypothetical protein
VRLLLPFIKGGWEGFKNVIPVSQHSNHRICLNLHLLVIKESITEQTYASENLPEPLFSKEGEFPLFAVRRSASNCGEGGKRG